MEDLNKFWTEDYTILYKNNNYLEFFPKDNMTKEQKLNSITRYSIYLLPVLFVMTDNLVWLLIPITIIISCIFFNKMEKLDKSKRNIKENLEKKKEIVEKLGIDVPEKCQKPSKENPYMNLNITDYNDNKKLDKSCDIDKDEIKEDIYEKFTENLYRNVSDVYDKHNSERQFYTMPVTTVPNDQKGFAEWLYKSDNNYKDSYSQ